MLPAESFTAATPQFYAHTHAHPSSTPETGTRPRTLWIFSRPRYPTSAEQPQAGPQLRAWTLSHTARPSNKPTTRTRTPLCRCPMPGITADHTRHLAVTVKEVTASLLASEPLEQRAQVLQPMDLAAMTTNHTLTVVMAPPNNLSTVTRRLCREPLLPLERLAPRSPNSERLPWSDRDRGSRRALTSLEPPLERRATDPAPRDPRSMTGERALALRSSTNTRTMAAFPMTRTRDRVRFRQSEPFTLGSGYHADNSYHSIRRD